RSPTLNGGPGSVLLLLDRLLCGGKPDLTSQGDHSSEPNLLLRPLLGVALVTGRGRAQRIGGRLFTAGSGDPACIANDPPRGHVLPVAFPGLGLEECQCQNAQTCVDEFLKNSPLPPARR